MTGTGRTDCHVGLRPPRNDRERDHFRRVTKMMLCLVGWRGPARQGEHGDGPLSQLR
nr:MAG TPA: hypothetical protein [Caudoviricetes sp.]